MRMSHIMFILLTGLLFFGCATFKNNNSGFSGKFSCPGYKGDDNEWEASEEIIEHRVVNGVDIIVEHPKGNLFNKLGPYKKVVMIIDGMWRYFPLYRNEKIYPAKVKNKFVGDNKVKWQAEYPELIDNKGKKRLASKGEGEFWIDKNGDKISTGSHYTGQIKCKRIK